MMMMMRDRELQEVTYSPTKLSDDNEKNKKIFVKLAINTYLIWSRMLEEQNSCHPQCKKLFLLLQFLLLQGFLHPNQICYQMLF